MMQYIRYWTKESLPFDDVPLFLYYYVTAAPLPAGVPGVDAVTAARPTASVATREEPTAFVPAGLYGGLD